MKKLTLLTVLAVGFSFAQAADIASWDIDGVDLDDGTFDASFTLSADARDASLSAAELRLGAGVNPSTTAGQYGFKVSSSEEQTTLAEAIANDHYIEFFFTAATGYEVDLNSITFLGQSSDSGADDVAFMSSVDGFAAGDEIDSLSGISGSTGGFDTDSSGFGTGTITLADARYQNLSEITFRLYGWNTSSGSGITYLRSLTGNDVVLDGTVSAVPEPATFALMAGWLGMVSLMLQRRRD